MSADSSVASLSTTASRAGVGPLAGPLAAEKLTVLASNRREWSDAMREDEGVHRDSDAAVSAVARVGGIWRGARLLLGVPRGVRDGVHRFVGGNWIPRFGRVESCALLSPESRARLLP